MVSKFREGDDIAYLILLSFAGCLGWIVICTSFWPIGEQLTVNYETQQILKEDRFLLPRPVEKNSVFLADIDCVVYEYGEQTRHEIDIPGQKITTPYAIVKLTKYDGSYFKIHTGAYESQKLAEELAEVTGKPLKKIRLDL